ncbi:MAG: EAL domain-containing protein [Vogesella sp.]|uniref:bifunctional diguanylate cyclase/phosphodiesterase n=1 Tax=Vogesella sp. TaxID=1904252 RepID=UPI00391B2E9B
MTVSQHILRTLLAILLPVALALAWLLYSGWQAQQAAVQGQLEALALQQQTLLDKQLAQGRAVAQAMAASSWAQALNPDDCPLADMRQALLGAYGFTNAVTLSQRGEVVCSVLPVDRAAVRRVRQLPQLVSLLAQQQTAVSDPLQAPISRRQVIVVSSPLQGRDGRLAGQLILALELAALAQATPPAGLPPSLGWQVLAADGSVILGQELPVATTGDLLRVIRPLQQAPWQVQVMLPHDTLYRLLWQQGQPLALAMLGAVLLALLAGWLLARYQLRSIRALTDFVLRVGRGEASLRIRPQGPAELQLLGKEINRMLDAADYAESRYRLLFAASTDGVLVVNAQMTILAVNEQGASMFGYSVDELTGLNVDVLIPEAARAAHRHVATAYVAMPVSRAMGHRPTLRGVRRDGSEVLVQITLSPLPAGGVAAIVRDVSERHQMQARMQWLAQYDTLTNLPNRALLADRLEQALRRAQFNLAPLALLLVGLDHFRLINDTWGHSQGDRVLAQFGRQLAEALGEGWTVARVGGDEFAVVVEDAAEAHQLPGVLEKVRQVLLSPLQAQGGSRLVVGGSIGVALFPDDAADGGELLKAADAALEQAKLQQRGGVRFYSEQHTPRYRQELELEAALREAIAADVLVPYFQPIVEVASGKVACVEVLVRWPQAGSMVAPAAFLPVAEAAGLLPGVEQQVRRKAFAALSDWQQAGLSLQLSLNVSAAEFDSPRFVDELAALVMEAGLQPAMLVLEITEGAVLGNHDAARARMQQLQAAGYRIAIDDFGTGYSSLSYLHAYPFDRLKLDRSFVARLSSDERARKVTAAIIAMAHELGLTVIAEGVEEAAQLAMLQDMGCDQAQGFHLYRPLPAGELGVLLQAGAATTLAEA